MASDRLECHIRYCFQPEGKWSPRYDVVSCGRGQFREVRVLLPNDKLLWRAPFRGALNSNRARVAMNSYLKSEDKRINAATCCNGDPE